MYRRKQLIVSVQACKGRCMQPTSAPINVAILARVSTNRQDTSRQLSELQQHATAKGWNVVKVVEETISGKADEEDRHGLREVRDMAEAGKIQKVLVHEVSRIARRNSVTHEFVEALLDAGVSLYWHTQGIETILANGKRNPAAGIMLALLSEMGRAETELLSERIRSGLREAEKKGVVLGRPKGSGMAEADLLAKHKDVVKLLKEGMTIRRTAKLTDKAVSTVQRIKAAMPEPTAAAA
jgi:DNA invertase Pin-like site-specific DNA recombinase